MSLQMQKKNLLWTLALSVGVQIPIHFSPMLKANCPLLGDGGLTPSLTKLEPYLHPINNPTHKCGEKIKQKTTSAQWNNS